MQLSQAFHGACEAESALKAPSRGQEQQCATFVQAIVFIFPCDWWCVGTLRAVHKTGRLSATFCAVATRTPKPVHPRQRLDRKGKQTWNDGPTRRNSSPRRANLRNV